MRLHHLPSFTGLGVSRVRTQPGWLVRIHLYPLYSGTHMDAAPAFTVLMVTVSC